MLSDEEKRNLELQEDYRKNHEGPRPKAWRLLKEVAPEIAYLEPKSWNEQPVPHAFNSGLFLALVACWIDPVKRSILRAIILDLLDDDLRERITSFLTEDSHEQN